MTNTTICRYFLQGACAFGDKCRFSHNKESSDEPSNVCRYYLAGNCAYGDKCRYQHSKPGWSGRGQAAAAPSNYSAPSGVPKPPVSGSGAGNMVKLPSGASEFGMVEAAPNWDDYMTPDEMDEFEQWQNEQAMAAETGGQGSMDDGDIMDPADIPLCNEYAATGGCSAGEECCYIHGDQCEICGYFCIHPYNPDVTAHHQAVCSEAMAAAAAGGDASCNGSAPAAAAPQGDKKPAAAAAAPQGDKKPAAAAAAADSSAEDAAAAEGAAASAAASGGEEGKEEGAADADMQNGKEEEGEREGEEDAVDAAAGEGDKGGEVEGEAAAADKLADKLSQAKVDS